jgi:aspartate-semialdehyde dehydrogenase
LKNIDVCVLGATGIVGREYLRILSNHPYFRVRCVTGRRSVGSKLADTLDEGSDEINLPKHIGNLEILPTDPARVDADLVFSPLPTDVARKTEEEFASAGFTVVTDASPHRMDEDVPLVIPEVNPEALSLIEGQKRKRGWSGAVVATPNCTAVGIVMTLKPLADRFGVENVVGTTLQAISGAGYPGVPSFDMIDNVIPFIENEEEKVAQEANKILSAAHRIPFGITTTRVPVISGHTASLHVELARSATPEEIKEVLASFTGAPQKLRLPTAPERPIIVREEVARPQPRVDRGAGSVPGMSVVVGRVRAGMSASHVQYVVVSNNTVRGGAGGAVLTAELMVEEGIA